MQISENTPARLKVRDRTRWISVVCLGMAGIFVARFAVDGDQSNSQIPAALFLAFGLALLHATDVTFDKIQRICAIRRFDVLRLTRTRLAFEDIINVRVEIAPFPENSSAISYRLGLVTAPAIVPLTTSYEPDQERYNAMRDTVLEAVFKGPPKAGRHRTGPHAGETGSHHRCGGNAAHPRRTGSDNRFSARR
jgi:hypothetical protein